jgi:aspartate/methionine/tyrosine aminotransferase
MGMSGLGICFCAGEKDIISKLGKLGGHKELSQKFLVAAIENTQENHNYLDKCRKHYLKNIEVIEKKLNDLNKAFWKQFKEKKTFVEAFIENPDATNVYLLDFSGLRGKKYKEQVLETGLDVAQWLLKAKVMTVPGECFLFEDSQMLVRIALNHPKQTIEKAFENIISATREIHNFSENLHPKSCEKLNEETKTQQKNSKNVFSVTGNKKPDVFTVLKSSAKLSSNCTKIPEINIRPPWR